jgi:hypothetical protein
MQSDIFWNLRKINEKPANRGLLCIQLSQPRAHFMVTGNEMPKVSS